MIDIETSRDALPGRECSKAARSGPAAPELRRIWEEILGCPTGDEESFSDLGDTSLRLARLLDGVDAPGRQVGGGVVPEVVGQERADGPLDDSLGEDLAELVREEGSAEPSARVLAQIDAS